MLAAVMLTYLISDPLDKTGWGWNDTVTARFLCPMRLIQKFDKDPEQVIKFIQ